MWKLGLLLLRKRINIWFHLWNVNSHHIMYVDIGDSWTELRYVLFHMWIAYCRKGTSPKNSQYEFSPSWYSSVTEEYQDGENSYCEFFGLVPFLQLAIHVIRLFTCYALPNAPAKFCANLRNSENRQTGKEAQKVIKASWLKVLRKNYSCSSSINPSFNFPGASLRRMDFQRYLYL
jgi:hypothetical protein